MMQLVPEGRLILPQPLREISDTGKGTTSSRTNPVRHREPASAAEARVSRHHPRHRRHFSIRCKLRLPRQTTSLSLKPTHATVQAYYETLHQFGQLYIDHEGAVRSAFQTLLAKCGQRVDPKLTLVPEYRIKRAKSSVIVDGALVDLYHQRPRIPTTPPDGGDTA